MASYQRFEDLPVWKEAIELAKQVYAFTSSGTYRWRYSLKDQLERAVLSISNNIAEGFERGTKNELLAFLYIAKGSAGESRSIMCLVENLMQDESGDTVALDIKQKCEKISRQLKGWISSLQESDIEGHRHLTVAKKQQYFRRKDAEQFQKELDRQIEELRKQRGY